MQMIPRTVYYWGSLLVFSWYSKLQYICNYQPSKGTVERFGCMIEHIPLRNWSKSQASLREAVGLEPKPGHSRTKGGAVCEKRRAKRLARWKPPRL